MSIEHSPALHSVNTGHKSLGDYRSVLVRGFYDRIMEVAAELEGLRLVHLSATAFGGGVAEIMYTLVPLMKDVGVHADWTIIHGADEFFDVTKLMHNTLQGDPTRMSEEQMQTWWRFQHINAELFDPSDYDVVVVHDPQPAGLRGLVETPPETTWIWRCHIDLSAPNQQAIDFLRPEIDRYDASIYHMPQYVPDGLSREPAIFPPAIDPLSPKNMALSSLDAKYIVNQFGIDPERPLICQVSRFDPWKDPLGVIDAYRIVKKKHPDVQLALVGSMAHDDPEGWDYYNQTLEHAENDDDIYILSNLNNVGALEVNAFQVHADVVMQKSIREGFGLTVSEALWKARPVVAGNVGGITSQIRHGETGFLVDSVEQAAECALQILNDPQRAEQMSEAGKEYVRTHFLTPVNLFNYLTLIRNLRAGKTGA